MQVLYLPHGRNKSKETADQSVTATAAAQEFSSKFAMNLLYSGVITWFLCCFQFTTAGGIVQERKQKQKGRTILILKLFTV